MLLIDTDMLILLAASGTLAKVVAQLGFEMKDVRRLAAASHQARKSKSFRDLYGASVLEKVLPQIESIAVVEPAADLALLDQLSGLLDPGEAMLVAIATAQHGSVLLSGDKRAILALGSAGPQQCIDALQGRVVTLEAVLWVLLKEVDSVSLRNVFLVAPAHKTLRVVLSESAATSNETCAAAIRSYYNDMHTGANGLLFNPEPGELGRSGSG